MDFQHVWYECVSMSALARTDERYDKPHSGLAPPPPPPPPTTPCLQACLRYTSFWDNGQRTFRVNAPGLCVCIIACFMREKNCPFQNMVTAKLRQYSAIAQQVVQKYDAGNLHTSTRVPRRLCKLGRKVPGQSQAGPLATRYPMNRTQCAQTERQLVSSQRAQRARTVTPTASCSAAGFAASNWASDRGWAAAAR